VHATLRAAQSRQDRPNMSIQLPPTSVRGVFGTSRVLMPRSEYCTPMIVNSMFDLSSLCCFDNKHFTMQIWSVSAAGLLACWEE
jgi:hypothetical protein